MDADRPKRLGGRVMAGPVSENKKMKNVITRKKWGHPNKHLSFRWAQPTLPLKSPLLAQREGEFYHACTSLSAVMASAGHSSAQIMHPLQFS